MVPLSPYDTVMIGTLSGSAVKVATRCNHLHCTSPGINRNYLVDCLLTVVGMGLSHAQQILTIASDCQIGESRPSRHRWFRSQSLRILAITLNVNPLVGPVREVDRAVPNRV